MSENLYKISQMRYTVLSESKLGICDFLDNVLELSALVRPRCLRPVFSKPLKKPLVSGVFCLFLGKNVVEYMG